MNNAGTGSVGMGMTATEPIILGFHLSAFLMLLSGIFYLLCAFLLWKPYRREKNELMGALFAFLVYQAVSMFFMGLEIHTMDMTYSYIASLAVFIGSAYMLKFPFSSFSRMTRRAIFYVTLVAVLGLFAWFMQTPEKQMELMNFTLWYDIIVNGVIVGGSIILFGLKARERSARMKIFGGGSGVVSCCVVANAAMISGAVITSSVFAFAAPVLILGSLAIGRRQ